MDEDAAGDGAREREKRSLASIVRGEAVRADSEERIQPDPVRIADGWLRRFVIERARAEDLVRLYEDRGFEVVLDPVAPELIADECSDCRLIAALDYVQVYTRKREQGMPA